MSKINDLIIGNIILQKLEEMPDFEVLTFENQGKLEPRTYKNLWENAQKIAKGLQNLGVKKGDFFAILLQNHPEFVEILIAISLLGAAIVPIDPRTKGQKLAFMLKDSGCKGVVCADYSIDNISEIINDCSEIKWLASINEVKFNNDKIKFANIQNWLKNEIPSPQLPVIVENSDDTMEIMYTSGTTGDPKGIIITYGRFGAVSFSGEQAFKLNKNDRLYTGLSLTHGNAQFATMASALRMGINCTISQKFTKSRLWEIIRAQNCTVFNLLGGMVTAIYAEKETPNDANNPVRMVISAGMPVAIWDAFAKRFDVEIFEFYGAMEGGMTINPVGIGPKGSCGRVVDGFLAKVIDENGDEVPPNIAGEICFKPKDSNHPAVKYHNNPEASAKKVVNGWLQSGDIVTMDENGWVYFLYRKGGGIRRNGDFINPAFIEKALALNPEVDDIFVYGVPNESGAPGEKDVVAAIVPKSDPKPDDIFKTAKMELEANMIPTFLQFVKEIPKTASEKPQERFLIEMFNNQKENIYKYQGAI